MSIDGRQSSARISQEMIRAAKFAFQSSARLHAKQSAASTRRDAMTANFDVPWPTNGSAS